MPRPKSGESKSDFMSRCVSQVHNESDKKDWENDRVVAYCNSLWEQYKESSSEMKFVVADAQVATAEER